MGNIGQPHGASSHRDPVERDQAQDLGKAEGHDRKVGPPQTQRRNTDQEPDDTSDQAGQQQVEGKGGLEVSREQGRRIGAHSKERRVAKGKLAQIAEDEIEPQRHQHEETRQHQEVTMVGARQEEGKDERTQRDGEAAHARCRQLAALHTRCPKRP